MGPGRVNGFRVSGFWIRVPGVLTVPFEIRGQRTASRNLEAETRPVRRSLGEVGNPKPSHAEPSR